MKGPKICDCRGAGFEYLGRFREQGVLHKGHNGTILSRRLLRRQAWEPGGGRLRDAILPRRPRLK